MLNSTVSGLVILLVTIFFAPAIFLAVTQMITGRRVNLDSYFRQVMQLLRHIVSALLSSCGSAGRHAGNQVPASHARWRPLVRVAATVVLIGVVGGILLSLLGSLAPSPRNHYAPQRYQ